MTIKEMRNRLVAMCSTATSGECYTGDCPLFELCNMSFRIPEDKCDADIVEMYNGAVIEGLIKED